MSESIALQTLVTEALFRALDEKKREELLKKALETIVAPRASSDPYSYNKKPQPSPLEEAFEFALINVAREVVREMVNTEDIKQKVRDLAAAAFEKLITDKDRLSTEMANSIAAAIASHR